MQLEDLGFDSRLEEFRQTPPYADFEVGRVISEHKERYVVKTIHAELDAEIIGNLRYTAQSRADFPAVGDWVSISEFDEDKALIHVVYPRKSVLERQAVGKQGEKQIIATNIDVAFIVLAVDRDFSINRIERYLTLCYASNISPMVLLNKVDLMDETTITDLMHQIESRMPDIPVLAISNASRQGIEKLQEAIESKQTYCLLGSSGVGKSTLVNTLTGQSLMHTDTISEATNRGKHVTTHRELHILENGGLLIDNPGMREVGIADAGAGIEMTFENIHTLAENCKYSDCTHTSENGCAVLAAVQKGEIDEQAYENYLRMEREKEHFESTVAERREKDKAFGKMVKNFKKIKNKGKH